MGIHGARHEYPPQETRAPRAASLVEFSEAAM
jgi:hypothetical protein